MSTPPLVALTYYRPDVSCTAALSSSNPAATCGQPGKCYWWVPSARSDVCQEITYERSSFLAVEPGWEARYGDTYASLGPPTWGEETSQEEMHTCDPGKHRCSRRVRSASGAGSESHIRGGCAITLSNTVGAYADASPGCAQRDLAPCLWVFDGGTSTPNLGGKSGYFELLNSLRPTIADGERDWGSSTRGSGASLDRPFIGAQLLFEGRCQAGKCVAHEDAGAAQGVLDEWEAYRQQMS